MAEDRAAKILSTLKEEFSIPKWPDPHRDAFQTLIRTVLSQTTADKNTARAFERLENRFSITPKYLANAEEEEIENAIRVAGLYKNRSKIIKALSRRILEEFGGSLDFIHSLPFEEARRVLLSFPGVGPKTADVVLLFSARKHTIPVDTHVNRVSKRLGLASLNADYEGVRKALQSLYSPEDSFSVHILFISLGRTYCKARKPLCRSCPVNTLCPSKTTEDLEKHVETTWKSH